MVYAISLIGLGVLIGACAMQGYFLYHWRKLSEETRNAVVLAILEDRGVVEEEKVIPDGWQEITA